MRMNEETVRKKRDGKQGKDSEIKTNTADLHTYTQYRFALKNT